MIDAMKNRPGGDSEAVQESFGGDGSSLPENFSANWFERTLNGTYVVVVQVKSTSPEPRYRRRFYVNLTAAQKCIDRAHQDGRAAYLVLCQLLPIANGGQRLVAGGEAL